MRTIDIPQSEKIAIWYNQNHHQMRLVIFGKVVKLPTCNDWPNRVEGKKITAQIYIFKITRRKN